MICVPLSALCNVCHRPGSQFALDNLHYGREKKRKEVVVVVGAGGFLPKTTGTKDAFWSISAPDANLCWCFRCENVYKSVFNVHMTFQGLVNEFLAPTRIHIQARHAEGTSKINRCIDAAVQRGRMGEDKSENRREGWI